MKDIEIILIVIFVLLYGYSNKIYVNPNPFKAVKSTSGMTKQKFENWWINHEEAESLDISSIIFNSGVCPLGRIGFYLVSLILILLCIYRNDIQDSVVKNNITLALNVMSSFLLLITFIMNLPLFIRSIPAFILLFVIINVFK